MQCRWLDTRIAIGNDGRLLYEVGNPKVQPEVLAIAPDRSASTAFRVDPNAREFAQRIAVQDGVLYVPRGSQLEREPGTEIAKCDAETGRHIGSVRLPRPAMKIAASGSLLVAIAETDDGYGFFRVSY